MNDPMIIVSGDGHVSAPVETYGAYLEEQYKPELLELVRENVQYLNTFALSTRPKPEVLEVFDTRNLARSGGEFGAFDVATRLAQMDAEGIAAEILHPATQCSTMPFFFVVNKPRSPEIRAAGARAYHRWLADFMSNFGGRLVGIAEPGPCLDLDETVRELRWCAANGYRGAFLPGATADPSLPPLSDPYFEPYWDACDELGLVLEVHAGWGNSQEQTWQLFDMLTKLAAQHSDDPMARTEHLAEMMNSGEDSPLALDLGPRRAMWQLMLGGVFDRHPSLKLALVEIRADWIPPTLARLDERFESGSTPLSRPPSEYYRDNVIVTPSSPHRCEIEMRHELGVEQFLFGEDFPHWEGTWPNTLDWLRIAFAGVPEDETRKILGENAIAAYGLDRAPLAAVAERIGPRPSDIFDGPAVDDALVADFNRRNRIDAPPDPVDLDAVDRALDEDCALVTAS
jgi:predicted TIM-barrel fold metal-dependent hydrolase